jgi:hypothetical protein
MSTPKYGPTKALARIAARAATVTGITSNRVATGYKRWADSDDLERNIRSLTASTQGYFWAGIESLSSSGCNGEKSATISAELLVFVPKDVDNDMVSPWDLACDLQTALEDPTSYGAGENPPSVGITLKSFERREGAGSIAHFDLSMEVKY